MAIYVDPLQSLGAKWGRSCHMASDNPFDGRELYDFALRLGLSSEWFQEHKRVPHYDLSPKFYAAARKLGAIEIPTAEQIQRCGFPVKIGQTVPLLADVRNPGIENANDPPVGTRLKITDISAASGVGADIWTTVEAEYIDNGEAWTGEFFLFQLSDDPKALAALEECTRQIAGQG